MMAPTDRSMPAVRMTSVCATPRMPMIVTCCSTSEKLKGWKKRSPTNAPNSMRLATRTNAGTAVGWTCRTFLARPRSVASDAATPSPPASGAAVIQSRRRVSAPAHLQAFLGSLRGQARHGLVGDELDAGVEEVETGCLVRLLARLAEFDDSFDALRSHQQRQLHRGRADDAGLDVLHAGATAVDRDDQGPLVLADRLQRLIGAGRGRLVDGVDEIDAGLLLQEVLHRLAAAL